MFDIKLTYYDVVKLWLLADAVYDEPEESHRIFKDMDVVGFVPLQNKLDYCLAMIFAIEISLLMITIVKRK